MPWGSDFNGRCGLGSCCRTRTLAVRAGCAGPPQSRWVGAALAAQWRATKPRAARSALLSPPVGRLKSSLRGRASPPAPRLGVGSLEVDTGTNKRIIEGRSLLHCALLYFRALPALLRRFNDIRGSPSLLRRVVRTVLAYGTAALAVKPPALDGAHSACGSVPARRLGGGLRVIGSRGPRVRR